MVVALAAWVSQMAHLRGNLHRAEPTEHWHMSFSIMLSPNCRKIPRADLPRGKGKSSFRSGSERYRYPEVIRWGVFISVKVLNKTIESFTERWNSDCKPIKWTVATEEIVDNVHTITFHLEVLLFVTDINSVAHQAA
jgi:hypothetical protein